MKKKEYCGDTKGQLETKAFVTDKRGCHSSSVGLALGMQSVVLQNGQPSRQALRRPL